MNKPNYKAIAKENIIINGFPFEKDVQYSFVINNLTKIQLEAFFLGEQTPFIIDSSLFDIKPIEDRPLTFAEIEALASGKEEIPSDNAILDTISMIKQKLDYKPINRTSNFGVKEGYSEAINILQNRITDISKSNAERLKTTQGRAIAFIAVDYLKGECSQRVLCNVPISDR